MNLVNNSKWTIECMRRLRKDSAESFCPVLTGFANSPSVTAERIWVKSLRVPETFPHI